ncbi:MAG: hypothetical protein C4527_24110 [Candidatus Omnitrophota bacterium]|nr:MAG: hypothetical protein C4527_24110 [Candidatus Omnitrophota bacterium]
MENAKTVERLLEILYTTGDSLLPFSCKSNCGEEKKMKTYWNNRFFVLIMVLLPFSGLSTLAISGEAQPTDANLAKHLLNLVDIPRGIGVVLGGEDGQVGLEIARTRKYLVHILDPNESSMLTLQNMADREGFYGKHIIIEQFPFTEGLPHAENTVDFILTTHLTETMLNQSFLDQVTHALRPCGVAVLGVRSEQEKEWKPQTMKRRLKEAGVNEYAVFHDQFGAWAKITKPPLTGVDEWSHWEHGPDNNPVSTDAVIKAPYMTQWLGTPYYIAMPAITTAAGGRIFLAMGHIAHHKREEPWLNTLVAHNGYNGTELWSRKLPDGYLAHRSAFIATDETFYMIDADGNGVVMIDPKTGRDKDRMEISEVTGEWKWIAMQDGILYALAGEQKDPPETTVVRSEDTHWSWGELSQGYYQKRVPWGFGKTIAAYDLNKKKVLWIHEEESVIDSRAMVVGDGYVYFYGPDSHIGCLNAKSGKLEWTNNDAETIRLIEEPGRGLVSTPGFRTMCFCVHTPEALFYEAQTRMNIVAISKTDGSRLWTHKKTSNNPNVIYVDGKLLVGIGKEGKTLMLDPLSGEILEDLGFQKRSCARLTATPDSFFCRGWPEGLTRYDRESQKFLFNGAFRPSCNDGVIGANGLLYLGPWACDCNLSLMGRVALCSDNQFDFEQPANSDPLQIKRSDSTQIKKIDLSENDWFTYRSNNTRNAASNAIHARNASKIWEYAATEEFLPTAPVSAGGLLFMGGSDGIVRAIDATNGQLQWRFLTAGPIMQPPAIWQDRAYVGSGDGYMYALEAATGDLLWRFRAAPVERRIPVYGSLCSTWPVNSGVLVENGVAYTAAGIIDYDGTYVYALDAVTGAIQWQNHSSGHLDKELRKGVSAQGNLTISDGRLWMPGGNVISPAAYDLKTGEYCAGSPGDGSPKANRGEEIAAFNSQYILQGGRLRYSATENVVNPGNFTLYDVSSGRELEKRMPLNQGKIPPAWNQDIAVCVDGRFTVPVCYKISDIEDYLKKGNPREKPHPLWKADALAQRDVISLALAENAVVVVCETPRQRTLAPAWTICALNPADGTIMWHQNLPSQALTGGLMIDKEGRAVTVLQNGRVVCYGGEKNLQSYIHSLDQMAREDAGGKKNAIDLLQQSLNVIHTRESRDFVVQSLKKLGVEVGREARQAGCIVDWMLIGPVPWNENELADKIYFDEPHVDVTRTYEIEGRKLHWREHLTNDENGMVELVGLMGPQDSLAAYAYAEVKLPEDRELFLKIGSNDGFKCWFNGVEIGKFDGGRGYRPDQDTFKVHGKKGVNQILVKITQYGASWAFSVRLTDVNNNPIDLTTKKI